MMARAHCKVALAAVGLGLLSTGAVAQEAGWYSAISGGISVLDIGSKGSLDALYFGGLPMESSSLDDSYGSFSINVGYRWNSYVATELGYVDLGQADYEGRTSNVLFNDFAARFSASGIAWSMLGMFPLSEKFDIHGRAGVLYADSRYRERILDRATGDVVISGEVKTNSWDLSAGIGAAWNINASYSLRVEYQRFFKVGDDDELGDDADVNLLTIGVLFK